MTDHTRTEKIGGDSIFMFVVIQVVAGNCYDIVYLDNMPSNNVCLMAKKEYESWLWHKSLGHASMHVISKLCQNDLVVGLPK